MSNPLISVIVPVYNVEKYLPACIDSILNQTYRELEIILVDDGATDNSGSICDYYATKYNHIRTIHRNNGGLSAARNTGIDVASGEYIAFVDSDDLISPVFFETLLLLATENQADIASVEFKCFCDSTIPNLSEVSEGDTITLSADEAIEKILYQNILDNSVCNKLYARHLFSELRFPEGKLYEDMALFYKVFEQARRVVHKRVPIYCYRLRKESITGSFSLRRADVLDITDEIVAYMEKNKPSMLPAALDRKFAANMNILWLMTASKIRTPELENRCWKNIQGLRCQIIRNPKSRLKNRVGALTAMFGLPFLKFIFKQKRHSR